MERNCICHSAVGRIIRLEEFEMKYAVRIIVGLLLVVLVGSVAVQAHERPHDPWVFYSVLEGGPTHAIVVALHHDLWLLYDFSEGALFRAINGRVDISDPTSPDPYHGSAYMAKADGPVWRVFQDGEQVEARLVYRGHRFEGENVRLLYGVILPGGDEVRITEMPDVRDRPDEDAFGLVRLFETAEVPEGVELMLLLPQGEAVSRMDSSVPLVQYEGQRGVRLVANGGTIITTYF